MRDNGVDMWIHVIRWGEPDPLELDLGGEFGISSPYVLYSASATPEESAREDYAIRPGDFLAYDMAI